MPWPSFDTYPGSGVYPGLVDEDDPDAPDDDDDDEDSETPGSVTVTVGDYAEALYERLVPPVLRDVDEGLDWPRLRIVVAIAEPFEEIETLARDTDDAPGWGIVLDVDEAPEKWLPWLGQFVGVRLPASVTEEDARTLIRETGGFRRGTPGAMRAAAQRFLTGAKTVNIIERDTSPYHFLVITYESQTPDEDAVYAALVSEKPAGLVMEYRTDPGWTVGEMEAFYATVALMEAGHTSVGNMESNIP